MDERALEDILDGLTAFIQKEVVPRHDELAESRSHSLYGADGRYTDDVLRLMREVREQSARAGYYAMLGPSELGGSDLGYEATYRVWEHIYRVCGGAHWLGPQAVSHWATGIPYILSHAESAVLEKVLPNLLAGTETSCFALSEPDAGSDLWRMRTSATRAEGAWILNGTKQWTTNSPYADWVVVFAVTDPKKVAAHQGGVTAFLVPTSDPGFQIDSVLQLFGHSGGLEAIVSFNDVIVEDSYVLGGVGDGLALALGAVSTGRIYNSARCVGLADWALSKAIGYAEERESFGHKLIENQAISFPLADSYVEVEAARALGVRAAKLLDTGQRAVLDVSAAKVFCTEMAVRVLDRAIQVHGGMGFTNEVGLVEAWQQARLVCVADGTAEILRLQIVKHLRRPAGSTRSNR